MGLTELPDLSPCTAVDTLGQLTHPGWPLGENILQKDGNMRRPEETVISARLADWQSETLTESWLFMCALPKPGLDWGRGQAG